MTRPTMNVIPPHGRDGGAEPGMDHAWYAWDPLPSRPAPTGDPLPALTFSVIIDLTAVEWETPDHPPVVPPPGGRGIHTHPDYPRMAHREYGHRTGIFRLLDVCERAGVTPAVVVDVLTATHYPSLLAHLRDRTGEFLAGGLSASRPITSAMSEHEERHYVSSTLEQLRAALGATPTGWASPQFCESHRTPGILAEQGVTYTLDWGNDEQPYPFVGAADGLWAYPMVWEMSDLNVLQGRAIPDEQYGDVIREAAEVLAEAGTTQPRVLALQVHPWLGGAPHVADILGAALQDVTGRGDVEVATPAASLERFRAAYPDAAS
jgi:allantoinase